MNTNIGEVKKMRVIHKSGVKIFITITFNKGYYVNKKALKGSF